MLGFPFGFLVYFGQSKWCLKSPGGEQDCASNEDSITKLGDLNGGQRTVVAGVAESVVEGTSHGGKHRETANPFNGFLIQWIGERRR
ncbi:hypothetical protein U1Q18_016284 [Sarracenia purpurea var. burkii]